MSLQPAMGLPEPAGSFTRAGSELASGGGLARRELWSLARALPVVVQTSKARDTRQSGILKRALNA